jgi:hypothetical protein
MKSGRKPNRTQEKVISISGLDAKDWLIVKNLDHEIHVVHRETNEMKVIPK